MQFQINLKYKPDRTLSKANCIPEIPVWIIQKGNKQFKLYTCYYVHKSPISIKKF